MIRVMLTSECNNNCQYCFVTSNPNYATFKKSLNKTAVRNRLIGLRGSSYFDRGMEIVGGEPFHDPINLNWLLNLNYLELDNLPVTIFTSAIYNVDEACMVLGKYPNTIRTVFVSYDGSFSNRNKDNALSIIDNVWKLKRTGANVGIRWSINKEDIPHLLDHFKEIAGLRVNQLLFFPMKYADYTQEEITLFVDQFKQCLEYAQQNQIPLFNVTDRGTGLQSIQKENFSCQDNLTILPDGSLTPCYVSFASSSFDPALVTTGLKDIPTMWDQNKLSTPEKCETCPIVFDCCNKCPGNLDEYQRLTGNTFFDSYCDLIGKLSETYINFMLTNIDTGLEISIKHGKSMMIYRNVDGEIWKFLPAQKVD